MGGLGVSSARIPTKRCVVVPLSHHAVRFWRANLASSVRINVPRPLWNLNNRERCAGLGIRCHVRPLVTWNIDSEAPVRNWSYRKTMHIINIGSLIFPECVLPVIQNLLVGSFLGCRDIYLCCGILCLVPNARVFWYLRRNPTRLHILLLVHCRLCWRTIRCSSCRAP